MAVYQGIADGKILSHSGHRYRIGPRLRGGDITITSPTIRGRFPVWFIRRGPHFKHTVKDAAVDRLQTVRKSGSALLMITLMA